MAIAKCEGCGLKGAYFGLPAELRARWCGGCGAAPEGVVRVSDRKKCEDCQQKEPNYGLRGADGIGKRRWCRVCAKAHAGAENVSGTKCENCGLKSATFGLRAEGTRRWCKGCAVPDAVDVHTKKCETCGLKQPSFGLPAEGKKRWCGVCAKAHAGAELKTGYNKKCESCVLKRAHYGLPIEGTRRWCMYPRGLARPWLARARRLKVQNRD